MKNKVFFIVVLLILSIKSFGQIKNGFWQFYTSAVSDTYDEGYKFNGNTFEFCISGYDGLNPTRGFGGFYRIKTDTIFFKVTYIEKYVGGVLSRDEFATCNNFWIIDGGKLMTIKLDKPIEAQVEIKFFKNHIEIDGDKFYLIKRQNDE